MIDTTDNFWKIVDAAVVSPSYFDVYDSNRKYISLQNNVIKNLWNKPQQIKVPERIFLLDHPHLLVNEHW